MNALRSLRLVRPACLLLLLSVAGCKKTTVDPGQGTQPATRTYTFKALAGISMGAMGATFLAGSDHHTKVDAVAALGGPMDMAYFLGGFQRMQIGGFCPLSKIEDLYKTNPAGLNDPTAMSCPQSTPFMYEHQQDYNHWQYTNNGGNFNRDSYLDLFYDLSLAMGNPGYYNPDSPIFPAKGITKDNYATTCGKPIVFNKANGNAIYNKEYNPNGDYDVITFCDGQAPVLYCNDPDNTPVDFCKGGTPQDFCTSIGATQVLQASKTQNPDLFYAKEGVYDPCYQHTNPVTMGLAVDINHNGIRDYFEPVVLNGNERFQDVGKDGCPDAQEDGHGGCTAQGQTGDPNGDNFDPDKNPLGTEGNWIYDQGEPYEDNGLDGVPNTHDYGEGNGKYDDSPNRAHWLSMDFRQNYQKWTEQERQNLDVYADGGIRDVFNFGLSADIMTSITRALEPNDSKSFTDYTQMTPLPGVTWDMMGFQPLQVDYSTLGRNTYVRYGTVNATTAQYRNGDGDHVGTAGQVLNRMTSFVLWMSYHWQRVLGPPVPVDGTPRTLEVVYQSKLLGGPRNFSIALPPGYDDPANANVRYPVFTMGHGYGMTEADMSNITAVFNGFAGAGYMLPMIIVYPSGRCCFIKPDGTKDCRDVDDQGVDLSGPPYNYERECRTGNFYVNRQGFVPGDNTPYGDAVFEILDYVDQNFRTLAPQTVPLKEN